MKVQRVIFTAAICYVFRNIKIKFEDILDFWLVLTKEIQMYSIEMYLANTNMLQNEKIQLSASNSLSSFEILRQAMQDWF